MLQKDLEKVKNMIKETKATICQRKVDNLSTITQEKDLIELKKVKDIIEFAINSRYGKSVTVDDILKMFENKED